MWGGLRASRAKQTFVGLDYAARAGSVKIPAVALIGMLRLRENLRFSYFAQHDRMVE